MNKMTMTKMTAALAIVGSVSVACADGNKTTEATVPVSNDTEWSETKTTETTMGTRTYSRAQIRQVQGALNRETAVSLTEDGRMGPFTTAALRQFQAEEGLPVTGSIDTATVQALGLSDFGTERAPASVPAGW